MSLFGFHRHECDDPLDGASPIDVEMYHMLAHIIDQQEKNFMATQAQLTKLATDISALITAAVAEITAAVAAAQAASPDPAIDTLDATVTDTTQKLTDAAAKLANPPA